MKIVQITPTISYGDAVSNEIFLISRILDEMGIDNIVAAGARSDKVKGRIIPADKFRESDDDIILYHMSIGSPLSEYVMSAHVQKKGMIYHNITPSEYFRGVSDLENACLLGRKQLEDLSGAIDFAFCDSEYNKKELESLFFRHCHVLPIAVNDKEYTECVPDPETINKYGKDDYVNIVFTGRIAPNKKQEDIILSFYYYNKYINPRSRLILSGGVVNTEKYMNFLRKFVADNRISNVIFTGHIPFDQIIAIYRCADLFLCESEHEGFCVPLLEAMIFEIPVLAYASSAIPYTLGESGVLFFKKNHYEIAECINAVLTDSSLREKIIEKQNKRLKFFSYKNFSVNIKNLLELEGII